MATGSSRAMCRAPRTIPIPPLPRIVSTRYLPAKMSPVQRGLEMRETPVVAAAAPGGMRQLSSAVSSKLP